ASITAVLRSWTSWREAPKRSSFADSDMPNDDQSSGRYAELKMLAAKDIRLARERFAELLKGDADILRSLLDRASAPGEGRIRHLIANALQGRPERQQLSRTLVLWLQRETDEFAKRAIAAALKGLRLTNKPRKAESRLADPAFVDIYRYVAD